jgi:5-methylcytosine-specific restriction endonuclease McrA
MPSNTMRVVEGHVLKDGVWHLLWISGVSVATSCLDCLQPMPVGATVTRGNRGVHCGCCRPHHAPGADPEKCLLCRGKPVEPVHVPTVNAQTVEADRYHFLTASDPNVITIASIARYFGVPISEVREVLGPVLLYDRATRWDLWRLLVSGSEARYGSLSGVEARIQAARRARIRAPVSSSVRLEVRGRDLGLCRYCGVRLTRATGTLDHVVPLSLDGEHTADNIVMACRPCNHRKRDRVPSDAGMVLLAPGTSRRSLPDRGQRKRMRDSQRSADWPAVVLGDAPNSTVGDL